MENEIEKDFECSQISDQNQPKDTAQIQVLQDELKRAKLDVQAYSTTITSLQQTLRAMEKTIQELKGMESLAPTKSYQKQENCHINMWHSVESISGDLTGTSVQQSRTTTVDYCFEMTHVPDAPISLYKGTSTSYLCRSYFSPSGSSRVFAYDHKAVVWSELPECPNTYFSLVTINGLITAVGGWMGGDRSQPTNTLLSLLSPSTLNCNWDSDSCPESKRIRLDDNLVTSALSWSAHFPAMPTKRGYPAVVYHNHSLIVAGGDTTWLRNNFLTTVEILNTITLQWCTASSLPVPLRGSTAAVCVNRQTLDSTLYLLGGWDKSGNSVYTCSLGRLLSTAVRNDPKETLPNPTTKAPCSCSWRTVAPAPFSDSSCVSLRNRLFVFGGRAWNGEGSDFIYHYHEPANRWICVGKMSVGRSHPLVAKLADDCRAVVVGGMTKGPHVTNCCEMVQLKF